MVNGNDAFCMGLTAIASIIVMEVKKTISKQALAGAIGMKHLVFS